MAALLSKVQKFEHNSYTGFEIEPNARILWTPGENKSVWVAVSRAVRTPSLAEDAIEINSGVIPPGSASNSSPFPVLIKDFGNKKFLSGDLTAFELGYRFQALPTLWFDLASYYNIYGKLRSMEQGTPQFMTFPVPHFVVPIVADNKMDGDSYGFELAGEWDPRKWLRFRAAYTYLMMSLNMDRDSTDTISTQQEGWNPHHQFSVRCLMDLPHNVTLDLWLRYVGSLPELNVDSYVTGDIRLAWKAFKNFEIAIVGQNLLEEHHAEFSSDLFTSTYPTDVERSVYAKITWSF